MNERKYVDPKADLTFKNIFGEHPDLITSLRNAPELVENPEVRKALEMVEASALTPEERAKYDGFQDWLRRER